MDTVTSLLGDPGNYTPHSPSSGPAPQNSQDCQEQILTEGNNSDIIQIHFMKYSMQYTGNIIPGT